MASSFNPFDNPELWDSIIVGGVTSPGIIKINDLKRKNEWDVKKGKGTLGATITFVGREPVKFTVTFFLWSPVQHDAWTTFRALFEFDPTKKGVTAISIYHPSLDEIGINSVVCEGIGAKKNDGKGMWTVDVDLLEYFPPPKAAATGTPNGTKTNASDANKPPGSPPDPIADRQQKEISDLLAKAQGPS